MFGAAMVAGGILDRHTMPIVTSAIAGIPNTQVGYICIIYVLFMYIHICVYVYIGLNPIYFYLSIYTYMHILIYIYINAHRHDGDRRHAKHAGWLCTCIICM